MDRSGVLLDRERRGILAAAGAHSDRCRHSCERQDGGDPHPDERTVGEARTAGADLAACDPAGQYGSLAVVAPATATASVVARAVVASAASAAIVTVAIVVGAAMVSASA